MKALKRLIQTEILNSDKDVIIDRLLLVTDDMVNKIQRNLTTKAPSHVILGITVGLDLHSEQCDLYLADVRGHGCALVELDQDGRWHWTHETCVDEFDSSLIEHLANFFENDVEVAKENEEAERESKPECRLIGQDGNVFNVIGLVGRALTRAGLKDKAKEFSGKAFSAGSYDEVIALAQEYVEVI